MRIAICDDARSDRQRVITMIADMYPDVQTDEFDNGRLLADSHAAKPYDIIIMDIIMPAINGIDTAAIIRETDRNTPIIFLSSSEEFGVVSYRVFAFDYLLKPVDAAQLSACLGRIAPQNKKKEYITVMYSGVETDILLSNICYLESNLRKVIFYLSGGQSISVSAKLTDYEEYLSEHGFCRCHKSFLVNTSCIDSIDGDSFRLLDGRLVKISRTHMHSAKKAYFDYVFSSD